MGVLNVTPDSFSDGGRFLEASRAVVQGRRLFDAGADIVDVGGESTRPGARPVAPAEEQSRVLPVVQALAGEGLPISIDTMNSATAVAAVAAGACLVNDVSGGLADPEMLPAVAELGVPIVLMHWPDPTDRDLAVRSAADIVAQVGAHLADREAAALAAGIAPSRIIVDPGLGFAKDADQNWALLADWSWAAHHPVLIGASRKRFLGSLLPGPGGSPRPVADRDPATAATSALAADRGAWAVRVHEVSGSADAVRVARSWQEGREVVAR